MKIAQLFVGARTANLARHAANGTLLTHLIRKSLIKFVVRTFVRF